MLSKVTEYFGCTGIGMPLENDGGSGSVSAHWEEQVLRDELATPIFGSEDTSYLSNLTLALLQDSGFYTVNYSISESKFMWFGRARGCSFLTSNLC